MTADMPRSDSWVRTLNPDYFALVMATGIVSRVMHDDGARYLSDALLVIAVVAYVILVVAHGLRIVRYRADSLADATDPSKAFAYVTFVAASNVVGGRLGADGHQRITLVLLVAAGIAWLVLGYGVPAVLIAHAGPHPALSGANGTWFICVVGLQSIAVATTALPQSSATAALAVTCWLTGIVLYGLIATLVLAALLMYGPRWADVTPPYWVSMGATAISVLAGAQILQLHHHDALLTASRPMIAGLSIGLWAFGTWLIPALLALGAWRHPLRRIRLRYEPDLWSVVFPIGMYGAASAQLGTATDTGWLDMLGGDEGWAALGVWIIAFAAMAASLLRHPALAVAHTHPLRHSSL